MQCLLLPGLCVSFAGLEITQYLIANCFFSQGETQDEEVNYMNNFNRGARNEPYSNTYNPGWRNFSYSNNQENRPAPPGFPPKNTPFQGRSSNSQKPSLESMIEGLANSMKELTEEVRSQGKNLKIVEQQVAQQAANTQDQPASFQVSLK